jgi:hypothetical protein
LGSTYYLYKEWYKKPGGSFPPFFFLVRYISTFVL